MMKKKNLKARPPKGEKVRSEVQSHARMSPAAKAP